MNGSIAVSAGSSAMQNERVGSLAGAFKGISEEKNRELIYVAIKALCIDHHLSVPRP